MPAGSTPRLEKRPSEPRTIRVESPRDELLDCLYLRSYRWLESCDLRVGQAEADFLRGQAGGGSITFTVSLTDKDIRGGDEPISSFEVVVTPESLAERESSVLWHRLFSQVGESPPFLCRTLWLK